MNIAPDIMFAISALVAISAIVAVSLFAIYKKGTSVSRAVPDQSGELREQLEKEKRTRDELARKIAVELRRKDEQAKKELIEYAPILRSLSNAIPEEKRGKLGDAIPESLETMMAAAEAISSVPVRSAAPVDSDAGDSDAGQKRPDTRSAAARMAPAIPDDSSGRLGESENSKFSFSVRPLLRGMFGFESRYVPNPDFSKSEKLIDKQEFFIRLQSIFNNMAKTGVYQVSDEDLRSIKRSVWTGDLGKVRDKFYEVNSRLWIEGGSAYGSKVTTDGILSNLCAQAMGSNSYWAYSQDVDAAFSDRMKEYRTAVARAQSERKAGRTPDPADVETESLLKASIEIIHEMVSVMSWRKFEALFKDLSWVPEKTAAAAAAKRQSTIVSNVAFLEGRGWKYLDFDKAAKTIHVAIPYRSIFSKEFEKIVSYYRSKRTVSSIAVYLTN